MLMSILDVVSTIGMVLYLEGIVTLIFRSETQRKFFEKHNVIKTIYMVFVFIGFLRFVFAIPSLV